jgi:ParB-like nuclease domain
MVPLADLTRYPGNARKGDVDQIRKSIRAQGQYRSLIIRDTGTALVILAGNHTRDALAAEGHREARCEVITCSDTEARKINISDNRLAEYGSYDDQALAELLAGLGGDWDGTGWSADDYDDLLSGLSAMPVLPPQATEAAYAETPEQLAERTERFADAQPKAAFGIREMVLVLPQSDYDELQSHIAAARRSRHADLTASEAVLAGMRAAQPVIEACTGDDGCAWCTAA